MRPASARLAAAVAIGGALALPAVVGRADAGHSSGRVPAVAKLARLWAASSPFNRPLPSNLPVVPQSSIWVAALAAQAVAGVYVNSQYWTTPMYHANASTPNASFYVANRHASLRVPFDPSWRPDQTSDATIAIVDDRTGCLYEMSLVNPTAHTANAEATFNVVAGSGVHARMGVSGSSFAFLGGLIRPQDVARGSIQHALRLSTPLNSPEFVAPATSSDGSHQGGIPEGQLVRLDPSLDLSQFHLDPFQRMVAKALQIYGAYDADSAGGLTVAAENTLDGSTYRYPISALPREMISHLEFVQTPNIPVQVERSGGRGCKVPPPPRGKPN